MRSESITIGLPNDERFGRVFHPGYTATWHPNRVTMSLVEFSNDQALQEPMRSISPPFHTPETFIAVTNRSLQPANPPMPLSLSDPPHQTHPPPHNQRQLSPQPTFRLATNPISSSTSPVQFHVSSGLPPIDLPSHPSQPAPQSRSSNRHRTQYAPGTLPHPEQAVLSPSQQPRRRPPGQRRWFGRRLCPGKGLG